MKRSARASTGRRIFPNSPRHSPRLAGILRNPLGIMPPYSESVLPEADVADIYAFLRSIVKPKNVQEIPLLNQ